LVSAWLSFHQIGQTGHHRKNRETTREGIQERTGHVVQEPIFVPEHRGGSNNCSIGERFLDGNFTFSLAPVELRGRVQRRVQVRDVDEFRNSALLCDMGDRFGTSDMDGVEIEVPEGPRSADVTQGVQTQVLGLVVPSDKVIHNIRVSQALCGLLFVPHVPFLPNPNK